MQFHGEADHQIIDVKAAISETRKRRSRSSRKVTVRLTEALCDRLEVATDRPTVGKSMVVEAALERFLNPDPSVEDLVEGCFDDMRIRFDRLERDMRMMAETVSLHARYHLAVMPPLPPSRQREATRLGDERFKVLAEQADRRVRLGKPLLQETICRLRSADHGWSAPMGEDMPSRLEPGLSNQESITEGDDVGCGLCAAAGEVAGDTYRRRHSDPANRGETGRGELNQQTQSDFGQELTGEREVSSERRPSKWRLVLAVFLPFAAGYFLSYLFRTINASISPLLASEFGLDAAETGLLASVYFLVFACAQLPIGVLMDRYGPRRVHTVLLIIAVGGATLFGNAKGFTELVVGRAMIGLGVAASLMAGLKAIVTWFPKERVAFLNGCMIMLGSLGAVAATTPTDWLLNWIGWRNMFGILTAATLATAGLIYFVVPERDMNSGRSASAAKALTLRSIFMDAHFLRIAPLSATCIGSAWALQSLWAASWMADVEGFDHQSLISRLFVMAIGTSLGALLLGTFADRLRQRGISTEILLAAVGGLFLSAGLALVLRLPLPSALLWSIVSVVSAATVLSYAMIAEYFPKEVAARANGALNLLHFGWAFAAQYGTGLIVGRWVPVDGHYPIAAYQFAFGVSLVLQTVALVWFAERWLRKLSKYLYLSFAPLFAERDSQSGFAIEGTVLETGDRTEW